MNRPAHTSARRFLRWALPCLCLAPAAGCIVVEDDRPLVLTISVFWEDGSDGSSIEDETCESGGVDWMDWSLFRTEDFESGDTSDPIRISDAQQNCDNFIPLEGIEPGSYVLLISGENKDGTLEWEGVCPDLVIDRFDWIAPCKVFLGDTPSRPTMMMDGGLDGGLQDDILSDGGMLLDAGLDAAVE